MPYTPHTWTDGETIDATKLNNMETGIAASQLSIQSVTLNGSATYLGSTLPINTSRYRDLTTYNLQVGNYTCFVAQNSGSASYYYDNTTGTTTAGPTLAAADSVIAACSNGAQIVALVRNSGDAVSTHRIYTWTPPAATWVDTTHRWAEGSGGSISGAEMVHNASAGKYYINIGNNTGRTVYHAEYNGLGTFTTLSTFSWMASLPNGSGHRYKSLMVPSYSTDIVFRFVTPGPGNAAMPFWAQYTRSTNTWSYGGTVPYDVMPGAPIVIGSLIYFFGSYQVYNGTTHTSADFESNLKARKVIVFNPASGNFSECNLSMPGRYGNINTQSQAGVYNSARANFLSYEFGAGLHHSINTLGWSTIGTATKTMLLQVRDPLAAAINFTTGQVGPHVAVKSGDSYGVMGWVSSADLITLG